MKHTLSAAAFVTASLVVMLFAFSYGSALALTNVTFSVNLTLSGNALPSIVFVETGLSANPVEESTRTIYVLFNASDNNGYANINYSSAQVSFSQAGETTRTSSSCVAYSNNSLVMAFNCTVVMYYYDKDGTWTITASVDDYSDANAADSAQTFSYGSLQALQGSRSGITFGSVSLGQNTSATAPLILDNTGNQNFTSLNVTAYNLVGQDTPAQVIPATSLYANATGDGFGTALANADTRKIQNGVLSRDIGGTDANTTVNFWVAVPTGGLSNQNYISSSNWILEAYP